MLLEFLDFLTILRAFLFAFSVKEENVIITLMFLKRIGAEIAE